MLSVTRSGTGALLLAIAIMLLVMPRAIEWLRRLKAQQSIREDVPQAHQAKAGTPTMGGLIIVLAALTATLWMAGWTVFTGPALALMLLFGGIGFLDDLLIARRGKNLGLRAREKFALQVACAALFMLFVAKAMGPTMGGHQSWMGLGSLAQALGAPLGPAGVNAVYVVLGVLFVVALANAVNFADGLDGLATGLTAIAAVTAALILPAEVAVFALAVAGGCLGFLWFNCNPARVFMGDTGSLALGGALGAMAVLTRTELLFLIIGAVYWAELLSVMIQVAYFKRTGRRVFRMSPIHHHFELSGWKEPQIVTRCWLVGAIAGAIALWRVGCGPAPCRQPTGRGHSGSRGHHGSRKTGHGRYPSHRHRHIGGGGRGVYLRCQLRTRQPDAFHRA